MRYLIVIEVRDSGTLNAWAETEQQGRMICSLLATIGDAVESVVLHDTKRNKTLCVWGDQAEKE